MDRNREKKKATQTLFVLSVKRHFEDICKLARFIYKILENGFRTITFVTYRFNSKGT